MFLESRIKKNVLLKNYSTFGIGGEASLFFEMKTYEDARHIMAYVNQLKIPYVVIGKGSNTLFDDRGFKGLVIFNKLQGINFENQRVQVDSGYSFALLGIKTALKGLSGLEFASGIPGSVGGAVFMNAGANQRETQDCISSVGFVDQEGSFVTFNKKDLKMSYRSSIFHYLKGIIVYAVFELEENKEARKTQLDIVKYRTQTQPYKSMSIGCIFRNPSHTSAGALIETCGLKGFQHKGAKVSELHANFIVNEKEAKAQDVLELITLIKKQVKQKKGVELQEEIRYIPFDYAEK